MTAAVARSGAVRAERPRSFATWALAARLARREVRRRKGRTALVVALVAIPVIAMTIASVVYRTTRDTEAERYARRYGRSDLVVLGANSRGSEGPTAQEVLSAIPPSSRQVRVDEVFDQVTPGGGRPPVFVRFTDLPLDDPITSGVVVVTAGRVPTSGADEVLLSPGVARSLGVEVGDVLRLEIPAVDYEVVGLGRSASAFGDSLMVVGAFDFAGVRAAQLADYTLVDLPDGVTASSLRLARAGWFGSAYAPQVAWGTGGSTGADAAGSDVVWGWVGGALALTVMGIIISAAFATSARRQLVTLGQLASNGADRHLLRRTLALQGAWSGVFGAALGIVVGLVLILPQHGLLERVVDHSLGPMTVVPLDLVIIAVTGAVAATIAAFVPSRTITKVPVLSALAGRRPLGAVPRWLVPLGGVLFAGGLALIATAAASQTGDGTDGDRNLFGGVAVVGGLGVLFGMCCATPAIIAVLGPIGERLTGTARLAARSLARVRTRSAAIVTAIAAAGALSIGGGTAIATAWHQADSLWSTVPYLQENMVSVQAYSLDAGGVGVSEGDDVTIVDQVAETIPASTVPGDSSASTAATEPAAPTYDAPAPIFTPVPPDITAAVAAVVPGATVVPIRLAGYDPAPERVEGWSVSEPERWYSSQFVVADPALLDAMGLSPADRRTLERVGVLAGWEGAPGGPERTVTAQTQTGPITFDVAPMRDRPAMWAYAQNPLITPAKAVELGLLIGSSETLYVAPQRLTGEQRTDLATVSDRGGMLSGGAFLPVESVATAAYAVNIGSARPGDLPRTLVDGLIVGGALLFILAVVAVGLALSAAESRDERDVLLAVGAPPRAMRRVSAQKAVLLTAIGGVLAVPTGFLPVAVVLAQANSYSIRFPWLVAVGCMILVPLIVGAATLAGSAIAQRARPVHMSTLATD